MNKVDCDCVEKIKLLETKENAYNRMRLGLNCTKDEYLEMVEKYEKILTN